MPFNLTLSTPLEIHPITYGLYLLVKNFLILFKFFRNFKFFRRKCCLPPFSRRSSFQSRAARAVLKSKLILAFVDAVWGGGAAALVQFLRSDHHLARGYRVIGESCAGRLLRKNEYSLIQSQTLRILHFFLRIFDEFFSGFRAKFQKIVTCVAFSIKFAKTNQKFAENSEFCENYSLFFKIIHFTP